MLELMRKQLFIIKKRLYMNHLRQCTEQARDNNQRKGK